VSSKRTVLFTKDGLLVEIPEDLLLGNLSRFAGADPPVALCYSFVEFDSVPYTKPLLSKLAREPDRPH